MHVLFAYKILVETIIRADIQNHTHIHVCICMCIYIYR